MSKLIVVAVAFLIAAYGVHRLAAWAEGRGWIYWTKRRPSSSAFHYMLEIQKTFEPGKAYMLEQKQAEYETIEEEGESGDPPSPPGSAAPPDSP